MDFAIQILLTEPDQEFSAVPCSFLLLLLLGESASSAHCSWCHVGSCWEKLLSSSGSGSVLNRQQHWDMGRSWTLAVWAGYTAGKVRFTLHRQSQVESHHPLWQTAILNSHCLCLTLSFFKSYTGSWAKGVHFEVREFSSQRTVHSTCMIKAESTIWLHFVCSLKTLEAIIFGKWINTKWLSSLIIIWINLTLSCFVFFVKIISPFFPFTLDDYETYIFPQFIAAFERKIFCERS